MKKNDLVFVYGTLRRGERADLSRKPNNTFITKDRINGNLYNLGWFPGVTDLTPVEEGGFKEGPTVTGEVFQIDDPSLCRILDLYEGHPDFFNRIKVSTENGLTVWVYEYPNDVSCAEPIPGGDWVKRSVGVYEIGMKPNKEL